MNDDVTYEHSDDEVCRRVRLANTQVAVLDDILAKVTPLIDAGVLPDKVRLYVQQARNTRQIVSEHWFGVMQKRTSEALWGPSFDFTRLRAEYEGEWTPEYSEDMLDQAVEEWYMASPNSPIGRKTLHEHLGMTWDEYNTWVESRGPAEGEPT